MHAPTHSLNDSGTPRSTRAASWSHLALRAACWLVLLAGALVQLRRTGDTVNADGIHYIELAQHAAGGHADFVSNGYWSPLYPALIAVGLVVAPQFHVDALVVARWTNLAVIVLCALAFEWLLGELDCVASEDDVERGGALALARRAGAYALLLWGVLRLQHAATVTPDLLVWTTLSLAGALLLRARRGASGERDDAAFGVVLGFGYLAKAVFFPVGIVALAVHCFAVMRARGMRRVGVAAAVFALVAAPLVAVQTWTQGHLSFGETGRLNYRWYVSHVGEPRAVREPVAVTAHRDATSPAAVQLESVAGAVLYAGEQRGSFPHGFDPSRSERRGGAAFDLASQVRVLRQNVYWYWVVAGSLTLLALLPAVLAALDRLSPRAGVWPAIVPAGVLLALYLLTHVEGRLCGPAIVTLLVSITFASRGARRAWVRRAQIAALAWLALLAVVRTFGAQAFAYKGDSADAQHEIASAAAKNGLRAGEKVAVVGSPYGHYWVHLAGLRIAAAVPIPDAAHPLDLRGLEQLAAESCARGTSIAAVVWQSSEPSMPVPVRGLAHGWWSWRPAIACDLASK